MCHSYTAWRIAECGRRGRREEKGVTVLPVNLQKCRQPGAQVVLVGLSLLLVCGGITLLTAMVNFSHFLSSDVGA